MLIVHILGVVMTAGAILAYVFIRMSATKLSGNEGKNLLLNVSALYKMGNIGLILVLLTGGYLMTPYWSTLGSTPLLIVKLLLFLIVGALLGMMSGSDKKAKKGNAEKHLAKTAMFGNISLVIVIIIIILAVSIFH